ncbi:MAG: hypothetical protein PVF57_15430 [Pseudomonadales bacterium]|jgi:hypothetical protein
MRIPAVALIALSLLIHGSAAAAFTLAYPDLDLTSAPQDVRDWARANGFVPTTAAPSMDETYERAADQGPSRNVISFAADDNGLKALSFDQLGILNATATVRRNIVQRYGTPSADQILSDGTLRITYQLDDPAGARRIFLVSGSSLSMLMFSADYFAELKGQTAREEQQARAAADRAEAARVQAEIDARNAWLMRGVWIAGIVLVAFAFLRFAPDVVRRPIVNGLEGLVEAVWALMSEQIIPIVLGIVLFGAMILGALAFFTGAVELGTSWWWGLLWLAGLAMHYKSYEEGDMRIAFLALAFYVGTFFGMMAENTYFNGGQL